MGRVIFLSLLMKLDNLKIARMISLRLVQKSHKLICQPRRLIDCFYHYQIYQLVIIQFEFIQEFGTRAICPEILLYYFVSQSYLFKKEMSGNRNMADYTNFDGKTNKKIVQAPGGASSFSLAWSNEPTDYGPDRNYKKQSRQKNSDYPPRQQERMDYSEPMRVMDEGPKSYGSRNMGVGNQQYGGEHGYNGYSNSPVVNQPMMGGGYGQMDPRQGYGGYGNYPRNRSSRTTEDPQKPTPSLSTQTRKPPTPRPLKRKNKRPPKRKPHLRQPRLQLLERQHGGQPEEADHIREADQPATVVQQQSERQWLEDFGQGQQPTWRQANVFLWMISQQLIEQQFQGRFSFFKSILAVILVLKWSLRSRGQKKTKRYIFRVLITIRIYFFKCNLFKFLSHYQYRNQSYPLEFSCPRSDLNFNDQLLTKEKRKEDQLSSLIFSHFKSIFLLVADFPGLKR